MLNRTHRRLILALGALVVAAGAVTLYHSFIAHRDATQQAAVNNKLDRLAAPAPRRDPVSLRPGGR